MQGMCYQVKGPAAIVPEGQDRYVTQDHGGSSPRPKAWLCRQSRALPMPALGIKTFWMPGAGGVQCPALLQWAWQENI
jgi:hypothetical protein